MHVLVFYYGSRVQDLQTERLQLSQRRLHNIQVYWNTYSLQRSFFVKYGQVKVNCYPPIK